MSLVCGPTMLGLNIERYSGWSVGTQTRKQFVVVGGVCVSLLSNESWINNIDSFQFNRRPPSPSAFVYSPRPGHSPHGRTQNGGWNGRAATSFIAEYHTEMCVCVFRSMLSSRVEPVVHVPRSRSHAKRIEDRMNLTRMTVQYCSK